MGWFYFLLGMALGYYLGLMQRVRHERRLIKELNRSANTLHTAVEQNQPPKTGAD